MEASTTDVVRYHDTAQHLLLGHHRRCHCRAQGQHDFTRRSWTVQLSVLLQCLILMPCLPYERLEDASPQRFWLNASNNNNNAMHDHDKTRSSEVCLHQLDIPTPARRAFFEQTAGETGSRKSRVNDLDRFNAWPLCSNQSPAEKGMACTRDEGDVAALGRAKRTISCDVDRNRSAVGGAAR